jgi:hypothetical protein
MEKAIIILALTCFALAVMLYMEHKKRKNLEHDHNLLRAAYAPKGHKDLNDTLPGAGKSKH